VTSFDVSPRDGLVIVPLVLAILAFAVYPQLALDAGEPATQAAVQSVVGGDEQAEAAP
jgi:NADH-quinone oxidoreductase subunit M